jgi:hypothetical protein
VGEEVKTYWVPLNKHAGDTRFRFAAVPEPISKFFTKTFVGKPATFNPTKVTLPEGWAE